MTGVVAVVVSLGMVVVVPLGLRLLPVPGAGTTARWWPLAGLAGAVSLWLPRGGPATALACGYAAATLVLLTLALGHGHRILTGRRPPTAADAAALTALASPVVAAVALVAERSGSELFGFELGVLALTVPHFHYAGFAAALVAHLVASTSPGPTTRAAAWSVPAGTLLVLAGYFVGDTLELVGAVVLTAGMWLVGLTLWSRRRSTADPVARLLLAVSALTLVLTMVLALDWALGHVLDSVPHLPIEWMAWTHGLANAVGFALCALVAWTRMEQHAAR